MAEKCTEGPKGKRFKLAGRDTFGANVHWRRVNCTSANLSWRQRSRLLLMEGHGTEVLASI